MLPLMRCTLARAVALALATQSALPAQDAPPQGRSLFGAMPLVTIGGDIEDRRRLAQLVGAGATSGTLIRTASMLTPSVVTSGTGRSLRWCELFWRPITPRLDFGWNSAIPFEQNDGGVWAGRGATINAIGGVRAQCGPIRVQAAPEVWYAQNRPFAMFGLDLPGKSGFTNPFFSGQGWSADLPLRFGNQSLLVLEPGQSVIEVDVPWVTLGYGTESQWWGPAIRNALVMSNHAAGIPSAYVRTTSPVRSPVGELEARWIVGALTESRFYDFDRGNDLRSLSGLVMTLRVPLDSNLTVGGARVVLAPIGGTAALPARFLDVIARWGESGNVRAASNGRAADQITSLFARWVFPQSGFEAFAEWARVILPASIRSILLAPQFSQGYTLGFQWISASAPMTPAWRVQSEITDLEQPLRERAALPPTFYVSPSIGQGYTQRGQVIGAMIGPGSQSQYVAVDRLLGDSRLGGFLGRVRWANDAFYKAPTGLSAWAHDVSFFGGVRGRRPVGLFNVSAELAAEKRLNYLFQSATIGFSEDRTFDVNNLVVRISLEPRWERR
jgi:hypothetical protein